ncbi:MAG: hypothetical protein JW904_11055 [Spirochaetales bacterium]|nr:hypothetical protein [Spirochaetales bacterium]
MTTRDIKNGVLAVDEYRLYELYNEENAIEVNLQIDTSGPVKAYAFTFG